MKYDMGERWDDKFMKPSTQQLHKTLPEHSNESDIVWEEMVKLGMKKTFTRTRLQTQFMGFINHYAYDTTIKISDC